jgi:DNA-binding response OmpR family regulator
MEDRKSFKHFDLKKGWRTSCFCCINKTLQAIDEDNFLISCRKFKTRTMSQKLLIVDDEPHIRMLIEQTLEELEDGDVDFLTADNGETALEIIRTEKPQLVFLDVMMPKMNGMDVCRKVKKELAVDGTYIILLTAKGQELDKQKGLEVGADLYMTKPFDPEALLKKAKEVLGFD